jgi:hypothetical protein
MATPDCQDLQSVYHRHTVNEIYEEHIIIYWGLFNSFKNIVFAFLAELSTSLVDGFFLLVVVLLNIFGAAVTEGISSVLSTACLGDLLGDRRAFEDKVLFVGLLRIAFWSC